MTLLVAAGPFPRIVKCLTTLQLNFCLGPIFSDTRPKPKFRYKLNEQTTNTLTYTNTSKNTPRHIQTHTHTSSLIFTQTDTDTHTQTHPDSHKRIQTPPAGTINYLHPVTKTLLSWTDLFWYTARTEILIQVIHTDTNTQTDTNTHTNIHTQTDTHI